MNLDAIVLAAGRSRRAGVFKPAHAYRGKPLLAHAVDGLRGHCQRVIVVTGFRPGLVADLLPGRADTVEVVNPDFAGGMFTSVRAGAAVLSPALDGIIVLPADCPLVGASTLDALRDAFAAHDRARAVVPTYSGRGGHPVLLPARAREAILAAPPRATLRDVIADLAPLRVPVDDPAVLMDLDTPADLAALDGPAAPSDDADPHA